MVILPAIDIKNGQAVRLYKGDFATAHRVSDDYMATAEAFRAAGARWVHMVDLDAAKDGGVPNKEIFLEVARRSGLKVELGGGVRDLDTAEMYLRSGVSRVVMGSAVVKNPDLARQAAAAFGERLAIGIDARGGNVSTDGWLKDSGENYLDFARNMCLVGVKHIIFTDINRDGMLKGPNHSQLKRLRDIIAPLGGDVIASGGVASITNVRTLAKNGMYGVIIGKAYYAGKIDLKKAVDITQ